MKSKKATTLVVAMVSVFVCLTCGPAWGQWTYFDNNADIRALHQRGDTLWIGTNGGVLLFHVLDNGIVGKIQTGPSLPGNSVRAIRSQGGDVYVGTDDGLAINPDAEAVVFDRSDDIVFTDIRSISWGIDDAMYLGTYGHGVGVIIGNTIRHITREDSLLGNKVFEIAEIDTARVYFATSLGLCAYRDSAWVSFQAGAGLPRGEVRQMVEVGEDRFYLLVKGRGVFRFNHRRSVRIRTEEGFGDDDLAVMTLGDDGSLWIGGRLGGIARYRRGAWTAYGESDADVARARWRCAYTNSEGDVFFGSADGFLAVIDDGKLRKVFVPSMLPSGYVGPIAEGADGRRYIVNGPHLLSSTADSDRFSMETTTGSVFAVAAAPDGQVWVSMPWGLLQREAGGWIEHEPDIEPTAPTFLSLAVDASNNLWAGAHDGAVYRYDGRLWVAFAEPGELLGGSIFRLLIDRHQTVWAFSASAGAYRYDGARWTTFELAQFDSLRIRDAALDATGAPVAITERAVWRYEAATGWDRVLTVSPIDIGRYRSVYFDASGRMYLGTSDGLALIDQDGERFIGSRNGLRGRDVTSLLIDDRDNLWVGFRDDGISRISLQNLW
jgi:ligand-binding sensor domain-containing protein